MIVFQNAIDARPGLLLKGDKPGT